MDRKITNVLRGAFIVVLGVLVAVCGAGTAMNTYFGVVAVIAGALMLLASVIAIAKRLPMPVGFLIGGSVLVTIAIALFAGALDLGVLIQAMVFVLLGAGVGFVLLGIYTIIKSSMIYGLGEIVLGGLMILFTALYLGIPEFRNAFWIVVGIVMIIFGVLAIIAALMDKKRSKK